jgi:hypothetical protein
MTENNNFIFLYNNEEYRKEILKKYEYFTNFDLIQKPITEVASIFSIINIINFTCKREDFKMILKRPNNNQQKKENLFYEFFIGDALNKVKNYYPNFAYTANYIILKAPYNENPDLKNNIEKINESNETLFNMENVRNGCINQHKNCILSQYIESINFKELINIQEFNNPEKINYNVFCILFQIYATLHGLKDNYCHNDLNLGNVRIINLNNEIKITYIIDGKKYNLITKYVPIIIDYAKNVIKFKEYDSNNFINTACKTSCNTHEAKKLLIDYKGICPELIDKRRPYRLESKDDNKQIFPKEKCFTNSFSLNSLSHTKIDKYGSTFREINEANDLHFIIKVMYSNFDYNNPFLNIGEYDLKTKFKEIFNQYTEPKWFGFNDKPSNLASYVDYNKYDLLIEINPKYKEFYCQNESKIAIKTISDLLLKFLIPYYDNNKFNEKVISDYDELLINCDTLEKYKYSTINQRLKETLKVRPLEDKSGGYYKKYLKYKTKYLSLKEKNLSNKIGGAFFINKKYYDKVNIVIFCDDNLLLFKNYGNISFPTGDCSYKDLSIEEIIYEELFKQSAKSIIISIKLILNMTENNQFIDIESIDPIYNLPIFTRYYYCKISTISNINLNRDQNLVKVPITGLNTYLRESIDRNLLIYERIKLKTDIYNVYEKIRERTQNLQNINILTNNRTNTENNKTIIIYHTGERESPKIWWNQIDKPINSGNNNSSKCRIEISIRLQTNPRMKEDAKNLIIKLFNILKSLQRLISSNGCNITDEYIISKIKNNMIKGSPGAFDFDRRYFDNFINLNELNFRELMELFYCCINCNIKEDTSRSIFLDLLLKSENIFKLKVEDLYSDENLLQIKETDNELYLFFRKYKRLNERLDKINIINIFCNKLNVCSNVYFNKVYKLLEEEQVPLTINHNQINRLGFPLSLREKSFIHGNETPYIEPNLYDNIGWKSGISTDYLHSGKIIDLANKHGYDLATGISGSVWRSLIIFHLLGLNLNIYFMLTTIFLNGCFHHSAFECLLSVLHFKKFLEEKDLNKDFEFYIDERILDYETITEQLEDLMIDDEFSI